MSNDLISRSALKKDFKERLEKAKNWKEDALIRGDNEIEIRADATINFICEVLMTINNAPTVEYPEQITVECYTEEDKQKLLSALRNARVTRVVEEERPQVEKEHKERIFNPFDHRTIGEI